jgi:ubiquinone/menaquinone biosynthesis C-methylase UbiE
MKILDILEEKEDQAIIKYLISMVDKQNINSICDYGCGNGRILKKIKKRLLSGIKYTGIDFWSHEHCESIMPENEEYINFIDNGIPEIEEFIENNHYGIVFSSFALHHFRLPVKELKRIERLVAPEGYLILIDIFRDYTHIPYTKEETCDLLLALDMEITDQKVVGLETTEKELDEFKTSVPEWYKIKAKNEYQDDVSKNRHPALMDVFESVQQLTTNLINKYGTTPDSLLITTAKKMI